MRSHLLSDYCYFANPPLPPCNHPTACVVERIEEMVDFRGNGVPAPEFQKGSCAGILDDISIGPESITGESPIATLLHDMIDADLREFSFSR